jgi:Amt family ammonium transporter
MFKTLLSLFFGFGVFCCTLLGQGAPLGDAPVAAAEVAAPEVVAPAPSTLVPADQAWLLTSAALVLFMTPGLAFFYGGLVGRKNVLSVLMQCFMCMALISLIWVTVGYSLAFSGANPSTVIEGAPADEILGGFAGNPTKHLMLNGVAFDQSFEPVKDVKLGISQQLFMVFQMMFAIITPGLIIGAFAERMKFLGFLVFIGLWSLLVYSPVCHWVWYGPVHPIFGLGSFDAANNPVGALDFAGGTVVHINAGVAALVCCLVIGPRRGFPKQIMPPHNLPFAVLGAGMLWFGWFGFNGGSAFGATPQAVRAFVTTQVAAATAGLLWSLIEIVRNGKPTVLGMITGAVAGLVGITPAAGFVEVWAAIVIGAGATVVSYIFVAFVKPAFKYDDSLDVFGVHGIAGIWGALATGIFAIQGYGVDLKGGAFYGNTAQLFLQFKAVAVTIVYSGVVSFVLLKLIELTIGIRCTEDAEKMGLDLSDHAETAYTIS